MREDLEMLKSKKLVKELQKARKERETVSLEDLLEEEGLS